MPKQKWSQMFTRRLLTWNDYEDSIQETIALRIKSDYIITRNTKDYSQSECTVLTPEQLTKILI